jgi:hypothetical protein
MIENPFRPSRIEVHNLYRDGGRESKGRSEAHALRALMLGSEQSVRIDMRLDVDTREGTYAGLLTRVGSLSKIIEQPIEEQICAVCIFAQQLCLAIPSHAAERMVRPQARLSYDSSRRPSYRFSRVQTIVRLPLPLTDRIWFHS